MTTKSPRLVTLRHALSGRWVTEAPHPQYPSIPQPYCLPNLAVTAWKTLTAAQKAIEGAGYVIATRKPNVAPQRLIYRGGVPFEAI